MKGLGINELGHIVIFLFAFSLLIPIETVSAEDKKQEERIQKLESQLKTLTEEINKMKSEEAPEKVDRIGEIERKLNVLAEEIENIKSAAVVEEPTYEKVYGQGPAASKVYLVDKGVSIGGYGEFTGEFKRRNDNIGDTLRAVLYFGYKFTDRIIFNSEIEFEHGHTDENLDERAGEVAVEFANLNFLINDYLNIRAGLNLVPIGIINEVHEPTTFFGALRPDVERFIIPGTWRDLGVGIFGQIVPGLNYRAYVLAGLDSRGFSPNEGIRGGRSNGNRSQIDDPAFVARAEYDGIPGLRFGGSFYIGQSGQNEKVNGDTIGGLVQIYEADAQFQWRGLEARGLFAYVNIDDADLINLNNGLEGADSIGEELYGFYAEAGYNVLSLTDLGQYFRYLAPFIRFEKYDTQYAVPSGFQRNPANDRITVTYGLSYKPIPNVVVKLDFQDRRNEDHSADNQFNVGLGYVF
jgi:hypothetical protein